VCEGELGKVGVDKFDPSWIQEALVILAQEIHDSIIITDKRHGVVFWNKGAERTFGYSAEEMYGNPVTILYPAYEKERLREVWKGVFQGQTYKNLPVTEINKEGEEIPLLLSLIPLREPEGTVIRIAGIAKDITELVAQRRKVENLTKFYESVFDSLPFYVVVGQINRKKKTLVFANSAFLNHIDAKLDQIRDEQLTEVLDIASEDIDTFDDSIKKYFKQHEIMCGDRLLVYQVFPIGKGKELCLMMQDMTEVFKL
jgi:PAS domain S-box-containing protein